MRLEERNVGISRAAAQPQNLRVKADSHMALVATRLEHHRIAGFRPLAVVVAAAILAPNRVDCFLARAIIRVNNLD